jgi:hypothetical protein
MIEARRRLCKGEAKAARDQPIDRPALDLIRRPRPLIFGLDSPAGARAPRGRGSVGGTVAGDPGQVEALDIAVKLLVEAGAEVGEITLPALQDFSACGQIILAAEAYAVHEQWLKERPEDYGARARERLLAGATLRAVDYLQAVRWRLQRLVMGPPLPVPFGALWGLLSCLLPARLI